MPGLKKPYVHILRNGEESYGGSQMWSENETIRICGCGPVAALDTILYLSGGQPEGMTVRDYNQELSRLCRRYFPLFRPLGINGLFLAAGMNFLLRKYGLPYLAFWAVSGNRFWSRMESLLQEDIPVIFSIGPNFPAVWKKERLTLYRQRKDGGYFPASSTVAHYITATACDETWLTVSSWGGKYYINRAEYDEYVRKHSASLVSNILMLRRLR